jgi:hypothetical protein
MIEQEDRPTNDSDAPEREAGETPKAEGEVSASEGASDDAGAAFGVEDLPAEPPGEPEPADAPELLEADGNGSDKETIRLEMMPGSAEDPDEDGPTELSLEEVRLAEESGDVTSDRDTIPIDMAAELADSEDLALSEFDPGLDDVDQVPEIEGDVPDKVEALEDAADAEVEPIVSELAPDEPDFPPVEVEPPPKRWPSCLGLAGLGLLSALLGALLAILVLWIVNDGVLDFRSTADMALRAESHRLEGEIQLLRDEVSGLHSRLDEMADLSDRVDQAQADVNAVQDSLVEVQARLEAMGEDLALAQTTLSVLGDDVTRLDESLIELRIQADTLEDQLAAQGEEIRILYQTTQRFDSFLTGLDILLEDALAP